MKIELSTNQAANMLMEDQYSGWSYNAALAIVESLEALEGDCGESFEFCPVAIRCDYNEYSSAIEAAKEYGTEHTDEEEALEYLRENTQVVEFDGGVVIQGF